MRTLNLGILAHVDAGKTSLTERLLYAAGAIDEVGSVDGGSTLTDSLDLERQRGITIRSAVASFVVHDPAGGDVAINLIDTPGHPDFIAEVERVLSVLDGAVLVVSAVEGVQAQTRVLMRVLRRLGLPTIIFVNKIDRGGAQPAVVLRGIEERLHPSIVAMQETQSTGTATASVTAYRQSDETFVTRLLDVLAANDDGLVADYLGRRLSYGRLRTQLAAQTGRGLVHPVYFGSAITGAGVDELIAAITELLPATDGDRDGPASGAVFKIERGAAGEKVAYVRMRTGTIRTRQRLRFGSGHSAKVTSIAVFERGSADPRASVSAGQIAKLWGLGEVRVGDEIGTPSTDVAPRFAPPTWETVVVPSRATDAGALHAALVQLAEQDPLINVRHDETRREISLSLYGEVQKEVIQAMLANDYGLEVAFRETTTIHIERVVGVGQAVEVIDQTSQPFLAGIGLRVQPAAPGGGVTFRLGVELGAMPLAFFKAVEETVRESLRQGVYGWEVPDCSVTMTYSHYWPRQSHAHATFDKSMSSTGGDFRNLTPLVLMDALRRAGTAVCEPIHRVRLEVPNESLGAVLPVLLRLGGVAHTSVAQGSVCLLDGELPAARVHQLRQRLASLTRGEGVLETTFDHYQRVTGTGTGPTRPRWDHNPLNRREYLLHVVRRV